MARNAKHLSLEGEYASGVLSTFSIIRGFATLQDLAEISVPFPMIAPNAGGGAVAGYQREIDPVHADAIKRYLQDGKLRFIPEVILSVRANYQEVLDDQQRKIGVISDDLPGLTIRRRWQRNSIATHEIIIERQWLQELCQQKRIRRIDGNHRLHLAGQLAEDATAPTKYLAPFCVVLLGPPEDANDDYVEAMLFHTINSTAIPLESEHALQLVLGQPKEYGQTPDDEFAASPALHLTRLIKAHVDHLPTTHRLRLGPTPAAVLHAAAKVMVASKPALSENLAHMAEFADELCGVLDDILARLPDKYPEFCRADFFIELATHAWNETVPEDSHEKRLGAAVQTLDAMGHWLGRDGLQNIASRRSLAQQLMEIHRAVQARVPKRVFLARWYPSDADGTEKHKADLRIQMIYRTLAELRLEGINLELVDLGTQAGGTFPIHQRMYEAIASHDVILVDLSGVRPNVCVEAGFALERYKGNRLLFLFQPTTQTASNPAYSMPPFDLNTFRYESISEAAEIPEKLKLHLKQICQRAVEGE